MTELEKEFAEVLENLLDALEDIRGIELEDYKPTELRLARDVLGKFKWLAT
tara:strand:- start:69 stop:221 length:153 start_codon:yes stop_codon:yes gene_type:complete